MLRRIVLPLVLERRLLLLLPMLCPIMQLWRTDYYSKQADGNRLRQSRILAPRGMIYDCNGKILVNNLPGYAVALQKQSKYDKEMLKRVSFLLDIPLEKIEQKIKDNEYYSEPVVLKTNISAELMTKIEEQRRDLPDVILQVQPVRRVLSAGYGNGICYPGRCADHFGRSIGARV